MQPLTVFLHLTLLTLFVSAIGSVPALEANRNRQRGAGGGARKVARHVEITEGLVDRLIELGKRFDCFAFPNRDHGLQEGNGTEVHVRMLNLRYLLEHLPAGPR